MRVFGSDVAYAASELSPANPRSSQALQMFFKNFGVERSMSIERNLVLAAQDFRAVVDLGQTEVCQRCCYRSEQIDKRRSGNSRYLLIKTKGYHLSKQNKN